MRLPQFILRLLRVSSGRAIVSSGLLHAGALLLLAHSLNVVIVAPRLAGSRQAVIQLEASFLESPTPPRVFVPAQTVDVTPFAVHAFNRTFVEMPSAAANWEVTTGPQPLKTSLVELARTAARRAAPIDPPNSLPTKPPIELPRAELPRAELPAVPPPTPITVPATTVANLTTPPENDFVPPPRYPDLARQRGWQGTVLLLVQIDAQGVVTNVEVEESSGYQLLDAAAVNAVRQWRYKPARSPAGPVATEELQPVTFRLPRR